jgi:hypothetical protein
MKYLFKFIILSFLLFSCATLKHKESRKESKINVSSLQDTTKKINYSSGTNTSINQNRTIITEKKDTVIKVDTVLIRLTKEITTIYENTNTVIHDTVFVQLEAKGIKKDTASQEAKETTIKDKKTIPVFMWVFGLFLFIFGFYKAFKK